ncbi:DinB family protein [Meiothermus cerbereus]|uniref:DinB family protein n=1 Tax=Meiothermus cerbereus TaxID=65552 RepID=UPI003EEA27E7
MEKLEYVQKNLEALGERDPLEVLAETPELLTELFPRLDMRRGCELTHWTAGEIYCHLADLEIGYGFRLRQALAGTEEAQAFDHDRWGIRYRNYESYSARLALEAFCALRRWNLELLRNLEQQDWDKVAYHPKRGPETIAFIVKMLAGHDLRHLKELEYIASYVEAG